MARSMSVGGGLLGLAVLGKGFVPLVLFAPLLIAPILVAKLPRMVRVKLAAILAGVIVVAAPWFILCSLRNGAAFWGDFLWTQHIVRFVAPMLEHAQPFWYYAAVLLGGLFPWTPLFALLVRPQIYSDIRLRLLAYWLFYGIVFFSVARNKLPGYLLPLLPGVAILLAAAWESAPFKAWWLIASCALLLVAVPTVAAVLPGALVVGLSHTRVAFAPTGLAFVVRRCRSLLAGRETTNRGGLLNGRRGRRPRRYLLEVHEFPSAWTTPPSARGFWRSHRGTLSRACIDDVNRPM